MVIIYLIAKQNQSIRMYCTTDECKGKSCICRHVCRRVLGGKVVSSNSLLARCPLAWGCVPKPSNFQYYGISWLPWGLDELEGNAIDICAGHGAHREVVFEPSDALAFRSLRHVPKDILKVDSGTTFLCGENVRTTSITTTGKTGVQPVSSRLIVTCCFNCLLMANQKIVKLCNVWCA